ncbi:MAG: molybdopterin-dependent oxidoreductase [Alphaproteobacteria bacterium]|nr:molybdopterin-dependent oxidoreductase [Alphaproteobacteria bacterium]
MTPFQDVRFTLNGAPVSVAADPVRRLADVLRRDLALTGTKIGCDAGDCGACTVLMDGRQICSCLVPVAQAEGRDVTTVEGLASNGAHDPLQQAFHAFGAAQCGICTPGMLMAASDLLARNPRPDEAAVLDALGGVLCRCTGYRKIVDAVLHVGDPADAGTIDPPAGGAVGARAAKTDGIPKLTGAELFGDDAAPADALWLRAVRSPYWSATFEIGDIAPLFARHPGLVRVLTAADVPGNNGFGIYPDVKDQPVLADGRVRYRGEAVCALVGDYDAVFGIRDEDLPIAWTERPALHGMDAALEAGAPVLHDDRPGNVLAEGYAAKGDAEAALAASDIVVEGAFETGFVEHAYIEPEAGWAQRNGDRLEIAVSTQTPYMDRDEVAQIIGIAPEAVRIVPTACGGGFGGKLDIAVQPLVGIAAWLLDRPVRCVFTRPESMAATTKRHPSRIRARYGCNRDGRLTGFAFEGDFNTGAYTSWGLTVKDRVPIHATGPYYVPAMRARSRAVFANDPVSGAFRGFGVPQAAIAHDALMDMMAERCGMDPLEFRLLNALRRGQPTATGQILQSAGLDQCLEALRPRWRMAREAAEAFNAAANGPVRRGVGIGCMWYGCGNTSLSNPSTMRVGLAQDGGVTLYSGAQDIGQGTNTTMVQAAADALGVPMRDIRLVWGDTDRTPDSGKSSASRQAYVSGNAAKLAGEDLRAQILRLANVGGDAAIGLSAGRILLREDDAVREIDLGALAADSNGDVLLGEGYFDPPAGQLDANGQGSPYGTYGFAAQTAEVEVDIALGTVRVTRIDAAHDVGRALNPTQVEGQIQGGVAQGIGLALMEEYVPGRTENLHDYLIPTIGDVPEIVPVIVEDPEPTGPWGAKGIGEPALCATAPAIFGAIRHATGVRVTRAPCTPDRLRAAILAQAGK